MAVLEVDLRLPCDEQSSSKTRHRYYTEQDFDLEETKLEIRNERARVLSLSRFVEVLVLHTQWSNWAILGWAIDI